MRTLLCMCGHISHKHRSNHVHSNQVTIEMKLTKVLYFFPKYRLFAGQLLTLCNYSQKLLSIAKRCSKPVDGNVCAGSAKGAATASHGVEQGSYNIGWKTACCWQLQTGI